MHLTINKAYMYVCVCVCVCACVRACVRVCYLWTLIAVGLQYLSLFLFVCECVSSGAADLPGFKSVCKERKYLHFQTEHTHTHTHSLTHSLTH